LSFFEPHFGEQLSKLLWTILKNKRARTRFQEEHDRGAHLSTIISNNNHPNNFKRQKTRPLLAVLLHFII